MANKTVSIPTIPTRSDGDTVASYNIYTDKPSANTLVGTLTPAEALAGKVLVFADGLNHNATAKTVWTTAGESTTNVSNIVIVDLSAVYEPWNQADVSFALLSNQALPLDVSQAQDGTGGKPMLTDGSDPSNLLGWNTFLAANSNRTHTNSYAPVATNDPSTYISYFKPLVSLTPGATQVWESATDLGDSSIIDSSGNFTVRNKALIGSYSELASNIMTIGVPVLVTIINTADNTSSTIQFDNGTPIDITGSAGIRTINYHGCQSGASTNFGNVAIGRRLVSNLALTGQALTDAKNWVLAGNLE